jgi:hypothetical protein
MPDQPHRRQAQLTRGQTIEDDGELPTDPDAVDARAGGVFGQVKGLTT